MKNIVRVEKTEIIPVHYYTIDGWVEYKNPPELSTSSFSQKLTLCIGFYDIGEYGDDKGKPVKQFINVERYVSKMHGHKMEDCRDGDKVRIKFKIKGKKWEKDGEWKVDRRGNKSAFPSFHLEEIEMLDVSERDNNIFPSIDVKQTLSDKKTEVEEEDDLPF